MVEYTLNFGRIINHLSELNSMLLANKRVAIVGGGPGGLTLARLLRQNGVLVNVYERDRTKASRLQGATLDLHADSGLKAIEAAGLMDSFRKRYRPGAEKGRVVDKNATILYDEHTSESEKGFDPESQTFRPEIDRSDLRTLLLDSLPADTVVWDSHLLGLSPVGDGWQLEFKNGTSVLADLVIGADGAHSAIRPLVTPITPFYAGTTIFQGNVDDAASRAPGMTSLLKGGKIYALEQGKFVHVSSKGDGSIDFYVSQLMPEDWLKGSGIDFSAPAHVQTWFTNEFSGWAPIWFELFGQVSLPLWVRPQYCMPLDQGWAAQPSITLLGDAAHLMPPSGEGVNLAMLDALELSDCLTSERFASLQAAIAAYEQPMWARASAEAQESLAMIDWMHRDGGAMQLVRLFEGVSGNELSP